MRASLSIFLGGLEMIAGRLAELAYWRKRFGVVGSVGRASLYCIWTDPLPLAALTRGRGIQGPFRLGIVGVSALSHPVDSPMEHTVDHDRPGKIVWMMGGSSGIGTDSRRFERSEKPVV